MVETWKRFVLLRKPSGNMRKWKRMRCTSDKDAGTIHEYTHEHESTYYCIGKSSHFIVFLRSHFAFSFACLLGCRCSFVCRVSTHRMKYHHTDTIQMIHWSRSPIFHSHNALPVFVNFIVERTETTITEEVKNCFCCDSFVMREGDNTFNKILLSWNFRHIEVHRGRQAQISDKMASSHSHICQFWRQWARALSRERKMRNEDVQ